MTAGLPAGRCYARPWSGRYSTCHGGQFPSPYAFPKPDRASSGAQRNGLALGMAAALRRGGKPMEKENNETTITRALFRAQVNSHALWGSGIALFAVIAGTLLVCVYQFGVVSAEAVIAVQATNPALWLLNLMPFVFGIWGQLTGAMVMSRAGEMVMDQTRSLSSRTLELEEALRQSDSKRRRQQIRGLKSVSGFQEILECDMRERGGCFDGIGVVSLDFNGLREVRGLVGDKGLDAVVKAIAERLQSALRDSDMLAHVRGDRFIIALYDVGASGNYLPRVCRRIHRALHEPLESVPNCPALMPRMGAVLYPRDASSSRALIQLAESERKSVKQTGGHSMPLSRVDADDDKRLSELFSKALDRRELMLDFLPQTGAGDDTLVYLRSHPYWPGQENGGIDEYALADLGARSGRLHEYLMWLFDESLRSLRFWRERQDLMVGLSIPLHVSVAGKFPLAQMLGSLLERYRLSPRGVVLEFSGQMLIDGGAEAEQEFTRLRAQGYRICLSGFGSEVSSLQTLLHYRPDEVRMSPELTEAMVSSDAAVALAADLARVAARLGAVVVMPGVTDSECFTRMATDGVQRVEGSAVGKAMSADRVGYWQQFAAQRLVGAVR